jgi:hypothetical protein
MCVLGVFLCIRFFTSISDEYFFYIFVIRCEVCEFLNFAFMNVSYYYSLICIKIIFYFRVMWQKNEEFLKVFSSQLKAFLLHSQRFQGVYEDV